MGMLFTCGESRSSREAALVTVERPSLALGHRPSLLRRRLPLPHPQVVKDVADKGDVADPALQGVVQKHIFGKLSTHGNKTCAEENDSKH